MTVAQTLVNNVNALIDALQALVNGVASAVTGDTDPLAALGNITVQTKAIASQNSPTPVAEAKVGTLEDPRKRRGAVAADLRAGHRHEDVE